MKKNLAYAYCGILVLAGFLEFIVIEGVGGINTYEIKGVLFSIIFATFIVAMVARNAKKGYYFSCIGALGGHIYTAYIVYQKILKQSSLNFSFQIGFYLWALATVLLLIDLFLKFEKSDKVPVEGNNVLNTVLNNSDLSNMNNLDANNDSVNNTGVGNYVLGTYIFGVNGYESAADKACALINDVNNRLLTLYTINADNTGTVKLDFSYDSVIEVKSKKKIIMNEVTAQKKDHTVENQLLGVALLGGPLGAIVGSYKVFNDNSVNTKVNYNSSYELSVEYRTEKGSKILMIYCNEEPEEFVNKVNSSLGR